MPNDHQKFTGINLPEGEQGTWRSLCGSECGDIQRIYQEVTGEIPTASDIANAKWVLGGSVFSGTAAKCSDLEEYRAWLQEKHVGGPEPAPPPPKGNGLRHDWRKARGTWLYPGDKEYWLASHRLLTWNEAKLDAYLALPEIVTHSDHVCVALNLGSRAAIGERPFDALKNEKYVRAVFQRIIDADKAPVAWIFSQEYYIQELKKDFTKLLECVEKTTALIADLCTFAVPTHELGELFSGRFMKERNQLFRAMRKAAPNLPLAEHERPLVEIPVADFHGVGGDVISLLQTGFSTPTGGRNRPQDIVTSPNKEHSYDGACGFIAANKRRMDRYVGTQIERHTNAVGEHSIPLVYATQPWKPPRTLAEAKIRGRMLLHNGAAFDLSAGAIIE
jgi:hypothetical protein